MFEKYQHLERLGTDAVEGILDGICHVFYKIDGTNGSVWSENGQIKCGSRNRELSLDNDNAGFMAWVLEQDNIKALFEKAPDIRLYGEWLVPHSLKTYRDDAWRRFYVFDVIDIAGNFIDYEIYKIVLDKFNIDYIPELAMIKNPQEEDILRLLEKSGQFLIKDGAGAGEGIVIKNYDYVNRFGQKVWAKIVTNEFKEKHHKEMGAPLINGTLLDEERIVDEFVTEAFVLKEKAKIELQHGEWSSRLIPELLGRVFHELIQEEMWNILREYKNPRINFKLLQGLVIRKTKSVIGI